MVGYDTRSSCGAMCLSLEGRQSAEETGAFSRVWEVWVRRWQPLVELVTSFIDIQLASFVLRFPQGAYWISGRSYSTVKPSSVSERLSVERCTEAVLLILGTKCYPVLLNSC